MGMQDIHTAKKSASITRPANSDDYTAGDVIGTATSHILTFSGCGRFLRGDDQLGGSGVIQNVHVLDSANRATPPDLKLWLFTVAPAAQADNVAFAPTDAEMAYLVGIVDLSENIVVANPGSDAAGNLVCYQNNVNLPFQCAQDSRDLYGVLTVHNAYDPVSGEIFTVMLGIQQDE